MFDCSWVAGWCEAKHAHTFRNKQITRRGKPMLGVAPSSKKIFVPRALTPCDRDVDGDSPFAGAALLQAGGRWASSTTTTIRGAPALAVFNGRDDDDRRRRPAAPSPAAPPALLTAGASCTHGSSSGPAGRWALPTTPLFGGRSRPRGFHFWVAGAKRRRRPRRQRPAAAT